MDESVRTLFWRVRHVSRCTCALWIGSTKTARPIRTYKHSKRTCMHVLWLIHIKICIHICTYIYTYVYTHCVVKESGVSEYIYSFVWMYVSSVYCLCGCMSAHCIACMNVYIAHCVVMESGVSEHIYSFLGMYVSSLYCLYECIYSSLCGYGVLSERAHLQFFVDVC